MKTNQNRQDIISKKCQLLEEMGFVIEHEDSCVTFGGIPFDFSDTACDRASLVYTAMNAMFSKGRAVGKVLVQESIKDILGFNKESEE